MLSRFLIMGPFPKYNKFPSPIRLGQCDIQVLALSDLNWKGLGVNLEQLLQIFNFQTRFLLSPNIDSKTLILSVWCHFETL